MRLTVDDLLGQIQHSHLLPPTDVEAVRTRWFKPQRKDDQDATRFCEWLRVNDYLTEFVLGALARGKADQLVLNQYRLTNLVRSGPEAGDFLATDPTDLVVRIRIVSPSVHQGPAWFENFREATQRAMAVSHSGVARVLDIGQARGVDYLVTEHVEGQSLEELLHKRGKLGYELSSRIFAIVFDALAALHHHSVYVGELSAQCLVLTGTGKSGSARTIRLVNTAFPSWLFDAAALGIMATEQLPQRSAYKAANDSEWHKPRRPEEDVRRLGTVFYRCVTGRDPSATSEFSRAAQRPPSVAELSPEVPSMLAELIDGLVNPSGTTDLPTAAALAKSLRVFLKIEEEEKQTQTADKMTITTQAPRQELRETDGQALDAVDVPVSAGGTAGPEPAEQPLAVEAAREGEPEIARFFRAVMQHEASDLHLTVGNPPMMRLRNIIRPMDSPPLTDEEMEKLMQPILNARARGLLEQTGGADFAYIVGRGEGRFRVNLFKQRGQLGLVARRVNAKVPTFEKLGLPAILEKLCSFDQGMVILAGVTGSGKSTTLAAMLDYINEREQVHILTIEDPIEYLFTNKRAIINQREVGIDVADWMIALKHAVRQDPDVILVGEMRDRETFEAGLNAAETGHLVFCTIHASSAPSTLGRILDLFPADMHQAIRQSLAFNLKAVVCQKLLPSLKPGVQRLPTNEIMITNPTIRDLIIRAEDKKLPDAIRIGMVEGMLDFNESLRQLVARGDVDQEAALAVSPNPDALRMALKGIRVAQPGIL